MSVDHNDLALTIAPDGTVQCLYNERLDLSSLGPLTIARASHVEPTPDGQWTADLGPADGPVLGPFAKRSDALAAEVAWLNEHRLGSYGREVPSSNRQVSKRRSRISP